MEAAVDALPPVWSPPCYSRRRLQCDLPPRLILYNTPPQWQLQYIDLHACCIGDAGASVLLTALVTNTTLVTLNLRANYITDASAAAVAPAVDACRSLSVLLLEGNDYSAEGTARLRGIARVASAGGRGPRRVVDVDTKGPSLEAACCIS